MNTTSTDGRHASRSSRDTAGTTQVITTAELNNRFGIALQTCNKLKLFWQKAKTDIKWKVQVLDAIIRSKLTYSLECVQLTRAEKDRLDAFQMKCLRRILDIPPTSETERYWTNKRVLEKAKKEGKIKIEMQFIVNFNKIGFTNISIIAQE